MVRDQDADVLVTQTRHDSLDILYGNRIDTGKRLVQHDEFRVDGQTTGYLGTTTFTTGQLVAQVLPYLVQTKLSNQTLQLLLLLFRGQGRHLQYGTDIILYGHLAEDGCLLRQITNAMTGPLIDGEFRNLCVVQKDLSLIGCHQTHRHVKGCRLARTIRAQQTDNLPLFHINGNMIHHRTCPIFLHQILRPEHHLLFFCHLTILKFATKVQIYLHTTQIMGGYLSSILEIQQLLFHFFIVPLRQC